MEATNEEGSLLDSSRPPRLKMPAEDDSLIGVKPASDPPASSCSNEEGNGLPEVIGDVMKSVSKNLIEF
ncbi:hypothetical protein MKX03_012405 [Papaver bracteatum]|nr:hypothetical protein MKX03_012405 [Papaver bracteatum]